MKKNNESKIIIIEKTVKVVVWVCLIFLLAGGCEKFPTHKETRDCYEMNPFLFEKGQIVKAKISGLKGMILYAQSPCAFNYIDDNRYKVRFQIVTEKTNTHLFDNDDDIEVRPFVIQRMYEYELKEVNN